MIPSNLLDQFTHNSDFNLLDEYGNAFLCNVEQF